MTDEQLRAALEAEGENVMRDGLTALMVAQNQKMCKQKGEKDTEFVKRIVATYLAFRILDIDEGKS